MTHPTHRLSKSHVTKKLAPDQPGAKKLTRRYGDALVCVRYRQDLAAGRRYTTVELVVDEGPIPTADRAPAYVHLRIPYDDIELRQAVRQHGGLWDSRLRVWRVSRDAIRALQRQTGHLLRKLPAIDSGNGKD